jgi:hypothetical protein
MADDAKPKNPFADVKSHEKAKNSENHVKKNTKKEASRHKRDSLKKENSSNNHKKNNEQNKAQSPFSKPQPEPQKQPETPTSAPKNPFDQSKNESPFSPPPRQESEMEPADEGDQFGATSVNPFVAPTEQPIAAPAATEAKKEEQVTKKTIDDQPKVQEVTTEVIEKKKEEAKSAESTDIKLPIASGDGIEAEEFKEEFWTILEQAGITKKRLIIFGVFFVIAIIVVVFLFTRGDGSVEPKTEKQPDLGDDIEVSLSVGSNDSDVHGDSDGLKLVLSMGNTYMVQQSEFIEHVELLRKLQNIYSTDVYYLMDKSGDRRVALEQHLKEMNELIEDGETAYYNIQEDLSRLDANYRLLIADRDVYEGFFFNSYAYMLTFIELEQEIVKVRARHAAFKSLSEMFVNSINSLKPRYEDISTNVDALLKGVRVFDIPNSDIEAIIRLEE